MKTLSEKYTGTLNGVAIGDALGLPVEMYTRRQILSLLDRETIGEHDSLLSQYYPISRHAMYRPYIASGLYPFLKSSTTGVCSDDTLLTLAIADSIYVSGGLDISDIINRHIQAVQSEPFGFGNGTRITMERIGKGEDWSRIREKSFGNGIMMKQSPFAFLEVSSGVRVSHDLIRLAQITHAHPVSLVAARVHHRLLVDIILSQDSDFDMKYWLKEGVQYAQTCENEFGSSSSISALLNNMQVQSDTELSLGEISRKYVRVIESEKNPYFNVLSTLGICYAIFLRQQDFQAVRMGASIGGDTDSYASILGGMVGALKGPIFDESYTKGILPRYRDMIDNTTEHIVDNL